MLTNSEWFGVNELSLLIHGTDVVREMQQYFLEALRNIIPFERAAFFLYHEESNGKILLQSPAVINMNPEIVTAYEALINTNGIFRRVINLRRSMAYRGSDFGIPDEKATEEVEEMRRVFLLPNDIGFYSGIVLSDKRKLIGEIILYRPARQRDFTDNEVEVLDCLKRHLMIRLRREEKMNPVAASEKKRDDVLFTGMGLTPRECEIAGLIMQQYSTEEISKRLVISQYTTKKHLHHIFAKLGVRNRMQLIEAIRSWKCIQYRDR